MPGYVLLGCNIVYFYIAINNRLYVKELEGEWCPKKRVAPSSEISDTRKKIQDLRKIISDQSHLQYQEAIKRNDFNYFVEEMTKYTSEYTDLYKWINRKNLLKHILKMSPKEFTKRVINKLKR